MAILEPAQAARGLAQGDVLCGLELYHTSVFEEMRPLPSGATLCMIVSRPCVLEHKESILVAAVMPSEEFPSGSFEDTRDFLNSLREGEGRTDRFYIGQLDDFIGAERGYQYRSRRHFVHLDALYTLRLCSRLKDIETRGQSLQRLLQARVATLSRDFVRNLQTRLFGAIAYEGFDDYAWYTI